jgi:hypothetical protein
MEKNNCKAEVQSGNRKGEKCNRIGKDNGYCIHHQRQYQYNLLINEDKQLCDMFFRGCNNELSKNDIINKYKNCKTCREKKSGKSYNCALEGCTFKIKNKNDIYCGKHIRNLLKDDEKINNIKYCNIDRGCFNKIIYGNKCEECKNIEKENVSKEITNLRQKHNIQVTNVPNELDKKQEDKTICVAEFWRSVQKNAYSRSLLFTLSESDFEKLVIQPCYYCGFVSKTRLNGIDRMNNNKGYILSNCISCCKMCNIIKNIQHPNEFLDKINIINNYVFNGISINTELITKWDGYLSKALRESYSNYKLHCDRRNISFLLTEKEYDKLINDKCYLCGITKLLNHTNGIDRFDSTIRSYTLENSKTCCGHCNLMKGSLSYSEFIMKCIQIKKYNCDRRIFNSIPIYNYTKCRNEFYTSEDIYNMMINGKYMNYIEWCREKNKTPEFISAMNNICNSDDISNKETIINIIKNEMEKERTRLYSKEVLDNTKNIQCTTLYSYLTQGKIEYFKEWYNINYTKSTLFEEKIQKLIDSLASLNKEDGIEACKKFMYDEKNRRNIQQRREKEKKTVKYSSNPIPKNTNKSSKNIENNIENNIVNPDIGVIVEREYKPINEIIIPKHISEEIKNIIKKDNIQIIQPKQWKTKQIYEVIQNNNENLYKDYCEQNNDISKIPNWNSEWVSFVLSVKGKTQKDSEQLIRKFVENLRRIRHNLLCNENKNIIERNDRQQWPATSVVRAFLDNKIELFKKFTEEQTGDNPDDSVWQKRWESFIKSLEDNKNNENKLKELCSKFMTAQRTKRYRHKHNIKEL